MSKQSKTVEQVDVTKTVVAKPKPKKTPLQPIKLEFALKQKQIRTILETAAEELASGEFNIPDFPVKIDDIVRNKSVIDALTKSAKREVAYLLGSLDDEDDFLVDVQDALRNAYRNQLNDAEEKEEERLAAETTTITVPLSKKAQIERILRDRGLLS